MSGRRFGAALLAGWAVALAASAVRPHDYTTWLMEVAPVLFVAPLLVATQRRFPLTPLVMGLIFLHGIVLMVGAHWTYAEVPAGFWVRDALHLARNHYDRLGHFMQGFVPALAAREVLLRCTPLRRGAWLSFLVTAVCLAASAFYEIVEWWTALLSAGGAVAFLGTQGDPWDTQWDMFLCTLGAITSLALLSRLHDREVARLRS